jgi:hypothetical protein
LMMIDFLSRTYLIPWRFVYAPFFHASFSDLVLHFRFPYRLRFLPHVRSTILLLIHCFLRLNFCAVCLSSFLCIGIGVVRPQPTSLCFFFFKFPYQLFTYPHLHPFFQTGSKILMPNSMLFLLLSSLSWNFDDLLFAGIGDQCKNEGIMKFTEVLSEISGAEGHCMFVRSTLIPCLIPKSAIQQLLYSNANH